MDEEFYHDSYDVDELLDDMITYFDDGILLLPADEILENV